MSFTIYTTKKVREKKLVSLGKAAPFVTLTIKLSALRILSFFLVEQRLCGYYHSQKAVQVKNGHVPNFTSPNMGDDRFVSYGYGRIDGIDVFFECQKKSISSIRNFN
jgi:hypothetical protein